LIEYHMVEIPDSLRSLFTATIEERDGRFVIEVPESEIEHDAARPGGTYRIAILPHHEPSNGSTSGASAERSGGSQSGPPAPPVDEGEVREVTIESVGDQGDGIAKVERGYVVIVPDAQPGDQPTVEIEQVKENVAFATILEDSRTL
jgi:predicted RNA-binding protein with TRAM domain